MMSNRTSSAMALHDAQESSSPHTAVPPKYNTAWAVYPAGFGSTFTLKSVGGKSSKARSLDRATSFSNDTAKILSKEGRVDPYAATSSAFHP